MHDNSHVHASNPSLNPLGSLAAALFGFYCFLLYSRLSDIALPGLKVSFVVFVLMLAMFALSGSQYGVFAPLGVKLWTGVNLCILASIPFSVWRGGSVLFLTENWWRVAPLMYVAVGLACTYGRLHRAIRAIGLGIAVLAVFTAFGQNKIAGRLMGAGARFGDSNYLGMVLLFGIPLWCYLASGKNAKGMTRVFMAAIVVLSLALIARTGSRGTMVSAAAVSLYLLIRLRAAAKLVLIGAAALMAVFVLATVSDQVRYRYITILTQADPGIRELEGAVESATARRHLFERSVALTLHNPVFGVGVNMFMVAENAIAIAEGQPRGGWHVAHNMYTQLSSETGIPSLICFAGLLVSAWRTAGSVEKRAAGREDGEWPGIARAAFWLKVSLLSICATGVFLSICYDDMIPIITGLMLGLGRIAQNAASMEEPAPAAAVPKWQSAPPRAAAGRS